MGNTCKHNKDKGTGPVHSIAEYAAPVWARSTYTDILDILDQWKFSYLEAGTYTETNQDPRQTTTCLKPTYVEDLYLLAGIATPDTRRDVCARMERTKQMEQKTHSLFGRIPARSRLKSRKDFMTSVKPSYLLAKVL